MSDRIHGKTLAEQGLGLPPIRALYERDLRSPSGARPGVVRSAGPGQFIPWNIIPPDIFGAPNELKQPYAESVWVHRAIDLVAGPIASVPLMFSDENDDLITVSVRGVPRNHLRPRTLRALKGLRREPQAQAGELAGFWDFPGLNRDGSRMSRAEFLHASVGWLKLKGEVFYLMDDSWLLPFPEVRNLGGYTPIIIARPDRMKHVVRNGQLVEWVYNDGSGRRITIAKDQVVRVTHWNPYDDWRGLAEMDPAFVVTQSDYAAGVFAKNLNDNNGDQGVVIVAKGGVPSDEQRLQIVQQLREKREMQQRGFFRPVFLTGDISVEDPHLRAVDAAFVAQRVENRKEMAAAFGVPASFFDPQASYSVGAASDRYVLIEETCMPAGEQTCGAISRIATRQAQRPVTAWLNWGDHSVMQQVREGRMDNATKLWDRGWAWEKISDYLALDAPEIEGGKIGYVPIGVVPVTSAEAGMTVGNPATDPAYAEGEDAAEPQDAPAKTAEVQAMIRALEIRSGKQRSPKKEKLWRAHMQRRLPTLKSYMSRFNRELMRARAEILRKLEQFSTKGPKQKASLIEILFDAAKFGEELTVAFRGATLAAMDEAGGQVFEEIGKKRDDPWKMPPPKAVEEIRRQAKRMAGVSETCWGKIKGTLEEGYQEGEGADDLAERVRAECNGLSKYEAKRVGMTETQCVFSFARQEAMKEAGVEFKSWLSSHGPNVRPAHEAAEAQYEEEPIPTGEAFIVDGEPLMYPGDPNGSAGNVINCQCISLAVAPPEEKDKEEE